MAPCHPPAYKRALGTDEGRVNATQLALERNVPRFFQGEAYPVVDRLCTVAAIKAGRPGGPGFARSATLMRDLGRATMGLN